MKKSETIDTASWFGLNLSVPPSQRSDVRHSENGIFLNNFLNVGNILFKYRPVSTLDSPLDFLSHCTATVLDSNKECIIIKV